MLADYPTRLHWGLYALLYLLLLTLAPNAGLRGDVGCWVSWATYMSEHGLVHAYDAPYNNYNPLYQYVLWAFGKLAGSPARIEAYRHLLRTVTLLFDFGGAILAVRYFGWGDGNQRFILSLVFLLNIGYLYNTVVWEQVDAILGTLAFAAVVQALRQRPVSSLVLFMLGMTMKSQAIIFLPPLLLLWVPQWWRAPRLLGRAFGCMVLVELLVLGPFIVAGKLPRILHTMRDAVDYFPFASMNCFNLWMWLLTPSYVPDYQKFMGITYKGWGLLSFCLASGVVLLPVALAALHKLRTRTLFGPADYPTVLLSLGLIPLVFCFFNTQMHERYWHPALLLLGAHALLTRRFVLFGVFSLAYFLNLEGVMYYLGQFSRFPNPLFRPKVVAVLFAAVIIGGVWRLYREANLRAAWQLLRQPPRPAAVAA